MIKLDWVITNGYIDLETIQKRDDSGWKFITTLPAKLIHPHAMESDKITIFTKYEKGTEGEIYGDSKN